MKTPKVGNRFFLPSLLAVALLLCFAVVAGNHPTNRSEVSAGVLAPPFQASTIEGKNVRFPGDYKGKVVLLDFWATWCPPCRKQIPSLVETYNQYHEKGFEILGVSLDRPKHGPQLVQFLKDNNMTWPQIYDGGYWKAGVAVNYAVQAIPCPVLVDGDTGVVIGTDLEALGNKLTWHVKKALTAKGKL